METRPYKRVRNARPYAPSVILKRQQKNLTRHTSALI